MQEMTITKLMVRRIVEWGGFVVVFHLFTAILYVLAASPAFVFKHGSLTVTQLHLGTATISLPLVFLLAVLERRLGRPLLAFAATVSLSVWLVGVLYVFLFIPEGKVEWNPSAQRFELFTTHER